MKKNKKFFLFIISFLVGINFIYAKNYSDYYSPDDLKEYFGTNSKCDYEGGDNDCRNGAEYKFFLKMYDIYNLYKDKYNVTLDLPLIMSALYYNHPQLPTVFSKNIHEYDRDSLSNSNGVSILDWEYDYKNIDGYQYLDSDNNCLDMQILAKNMVKKKISYKCITEGDEEKSETKEAIDIETSNYSKETLPCESGTYDEDSVSASYELDEEKYKDFLLEYVELKYHTSGSGNTSCDFVNSRDTGNLDGNYVGDLNFVTGNFSPIHYYNQGDYSNHSYGGYGTIASHGCGPTSLAIVISSILNESHDPIELTNYICSTGGCTNDGTAWDAITQTPKHYGLDVTRTGNTQEVVNSLGSGNALVIALMCPGHFTRGGHFITLTGTTSSGKVTVADPASRDRSTEWDFNTVAEETCSGGGQPYWIISKGNWKTTTKANNNSSKSNSSNSKSSHKIQGVTKINQHSVGLPTGCETCSAVMLMNYYDLGINSVDFAKNYLITKPYSNGKGPDPNSAFVGSPFSSVNSFGIYAPAMAKSMNKYLSSRGKKAYNISGTSLNQLVEKYISKNIPVMVWGTVGMKSLSNGATWTINYTDSSAKYKKGDTFTWRRPEHCLVLIGYDENYYYFNDPATGSEEKYSKSDVESSYNGLGKQAIIIK